MNSPSRQTGIPAAALRGFCKVRHCSELVPRGRVLCDRHEAMGPDHLADQIAKANREFVEGAKAEDIDRAMRALERGLIAERQLIRAIEQEELGNVESF